MGLKSDIDSCFQSVSEGKSAIASAITDKGVSTASDATFQTMANNIAKIKSAKTFQNQVVKARSSMNGKNGDWTAAIPSSASFALVSSHGGIIYGDENVWILFDSKMIVSFYQMSTIDRAQLVYAKFGETVRIGISLSISGQVTVSGSTLHFKFDINEDWPNPLIEFYK